MNSEALHPALLADLRAKDVDIERTLAVLDLAEAARSRGGPSASEPSLPLPDDPRIVDRTVPTAVELDAVAAARRLAELGIDPEGAFSLRGGRAVFDRPALRRLGVLLFPKVAYGVLNGGSATTYADAGKNRDLDPAAFAALEGEFRRIAGASKDVPKGLAPAFVEADGTDGPSFLLLKMRALLIRALEYRVLSGNESTELPPFFQMTSGGTDAPLAAAYEEYRRHPMLAPLIDRTGLDPCRPLSAVQPLLAALTHSSEGFPRRIFSKAGGRENSALALPGGHGENFRVLAGVYADLRARGVKWAYLGNVDNSGFCVDPESVAALALAGAEEGRFAPAAFEFSWRTKVDVKGGVLVQDEEARLTIADIGQAVSRDRLACEEAAGKRALFNCATGLFDLDYLVPRLGAIADGLPLRISDQDKEAGRYAQAEQTTWEIMGLLEDPLVLAVAKEKRFVAAKMLMETLLASPVGARLDARADVDPNVKETATVLRAGLGRLLETEYGFARETGGRRPLELAELEARLAR